MVEGIRFREIGSRRRRKYIMKKSFIIGTLCTCALAAAQTQSSTSSGLGKCQDIYARDCEILYGTYSAMDVAHLEQRFLSQDSSMTFDELSILQKGYSQNRIHKTVSGSNPVNGSLAGEALVTFARSCCLNNQFKTYGQFLNLIKTPVYGQADCLASQSSTAKDKVIEGVQAGTAQALMKGIQE
jgi:hypothetical protein